MVRVHIEGSIFATCSNDHTIRVWLTNSKDCKVRKIKLSTKIPSFTHDTMYIYIYVFIYGRLNYGIMSIQ